MSVSYLLDTTVLLHWTRNDAQAKSIDELFHLSQSALRPLICEVSLGEMLAFSRSLKWGPQKLKRLAEIEQWVVAIDISDSRVREAYADLSTLAKSSGWSLFRGKNDLWVGAAAQVAGAHLLTMDTDFLPLVGRPDWRVSVLHPQNGDAHRPIASAARSHVACTACVRSEHGVSWRSRKSIVAIHRREFVTRDR